MPYTRGKSCRNWRSSHGVIAAISSAWYVPCHPPFVHEPGRRHNWPGPYLPSMNINEILDRGCIKTNQKHLWNHGWNWIINQLRGMNIHRSQPILPWKPSYIITSFFCSVNHLTHTHHLQDAAPEACEEVCSARIYHPPGCVMICPEMGYFPTINHEKSW